MSIDEKRAILLLQASIFSFHGLEADERKSLEILAKKLSATDQLKWVLKYFREHQQGMYDEIYDQLVATFKGFDGDRRLHFLDMVWQANLEKGYATEIEANAVLKLAKAVDIDDEFMEMVK